MNEIKVKYCGLTTHQDVMNAAKAGVDAVGFVLVKKSPRFVSNEVAAELIAAAKKKGMTTVVLFADHDVEFVRQAIIDCRPHIVQFHGFESAEYCEQFGHRYWKAIPMLTVTDYIDYMTRYKRAEGFLLDTYGRVQSGGSGKAFEWFKFSEKHKSKMILAGGLHQTNVIDAILKTGAEFIDTSSGIEEMKGVKSADKMMAFMQQIKRLNYQIKINKKHLE